jgi:hypothetical protein
VWGKASPSPVGVASGERHPGGGESSGGGPGGGEGGDAMDGDGVHGRSAGGGGEAGGKLGAMHMENIGREWPEGNFTKSGAADVRARRMRQAISWPA